jgi:DNA-binding transcriptional regulator YhcF (GntR family)
MKRKHKVFPGEIEEFLRANGNAVTIRKIAKEFDCTPRTIRKKLRILRDEGKPMMPTQKGILNADKVTDEARAKLIKDAVEWVVKSIHNLSGIAAVERKPLLQARKLLQSPEDRKQIKAQLMMLVHAIDIIDIDHQLEE